MFWNGGDMFVVQTANLISDESKIPIDVYVVAYPGGIIESVLDYVLDQRLRRSLRWMYGVCTSVRLLIKYLQSNPTQTCDAKTLVNFAERLLFGSVDSSLGRDLTELFWKPSGPDVTNTILAFLRGYFEYICSDEAKPLSTGWVSSHDRLCALAGFIYRRDRALLGHLWEGGSGGPYGELRIRYGTVANRDPPAFPEDRFDDLINDGYRVGNKHDLRGILGVLLMDGAGFRASETMHLFTSDVRPDPDNPKSALVRIHHPQFGEAPSDWEDFSGKRIVGNRIQYLESQWGLVPRNRVNSKLHAGWKGGLLDGKYYKEAHWFLPERGEMFMRYWLLYMRQLATIRRLHPYALVNLEKTTVGKIYCLDEQYKAHQRACRRIGLTPSKETGVSPHGHRHAYGKRLSDGECSEKLIQICLHHSDIASQEVYTQLSSKTIRSGLEDAVKKIEKKYSV